MYIVYMHIVHSVLIESRSIVGIAKHKKTCF